MKIKLDKENAEIMGLKENQSIRVLNENKFRHDNPEEQKIILQEMIDSNDVKHLTDIINKKLGTNIQPIYSVEKSRRSSSYYLKITSKNLSNETGVMKHIFKSLKLSEFNFGFVSDESAYWGNVYFQFDYTDSGSNGTSIIDGFRYNYETNNWTFR